MQANIQLLDTEDIGDFIKLILVFEEVFEMQNFILPDKTYLQNLLIQPNFKTWVAKVENQILGGLTVYILKQYYSQRPLAYIYDLAVKTKFQRKGIASKLIETVKKYCKEQNFEEVFVQADRIDDYALQFYRSTGITEEEDVIHFYYKL